MPNPIPTQTDSEEEIRRYLQIITEEDSLPYATAEFLSRTAADQFLGAAGKALTPALSTFNLALMPAQLLIAGYARLDPSAKPVQQAWKVTAQIGKCLILSTAGPLGVLVGGAMLGLSVLAMLDAAEAAADQKRQDELVKSMAAKLDAIRIAAKERVQTAQQREGLATDVDDRDKQIVLAWVRGRPFTVHDHTQTAKFFGDTLPQISSQMGLKLPPDRSGLRARVMQLHNNDLAMVYAMGAPLIELEPEKADERAKKAMIEFENEVFNFVDDVISERREQAPDEGIGGQPGHSVASTVPGKSVTGSQPGHSVGGAQPGHSVGGGQPGHPVSGGQPGHPGGGGQPGHSVASTVPAMSVTGSGQPGHSVGGGQPGHPDSGGQPGHPAGGGQPGHPDSGAQPGHSVGGGQPGHPAGGGQPGKRT